MAAVAQEATPACYFTRQLLDLHQHWSQVVRQFDLIQSWFILVPQFLLVQTDLNGEASLCFLLKHVKSLCFNE
jgi:hypothetical protein